MTSLAESGVAPAEGAAARDRGRHRGIGTGRSAGASGGIARRRSGGEPARWMRGRRFVLRRERQDYTQRAPRPRPGFDRQRGGRRAGGRRFPRREQQEVPKISDLLKERPGNSGADCQGAHRQKGARITSHIALAGRFLVYMPTVNHTGVSRKIASDEERQRLKRIVMSERDNGHGGSIVRTAAQVPAKKSCGLTFVS